MDGKNLLSKYFDIQVEQVIQDGGTSRYVSEGSLYTIIEATKMEQKWLAELHNMAEHLIKEGDKRASRFIPSTEGRFLVNEEKKDYVVLKNQYKPASRSQTLGRRLARFHHRGRSIPVDLEETSRIGKWKELWGKRLDQLEEKVMQIIQNYPDEPIETLLIDAFPYYMGLAENAIQYLVDTELDEKPQIRDAGTICHERFTNETWNSTYGIREPFDWVFDHASRDVAEWIRDAYWDRSLLYHSNMQNFLGQYQSLQPLSAFSWRLIYARLLFPLHFFENVENYYLTSSIQKKKMIEERLERMVKDTESYEKFLASFYDLAKVPIRKMNIPLVSWLR
ncbi:MAG TPA: spore coat protein YutH [Chondromyces sp.]|nr:spore coat protein YutH [Chondromyces sp.]